MNLKHTIIIIPVSVAIAFLAILILSEIDSINFNTQKTPNQNFKIAFIGDQGLGPSSIAVLNLIKQEESDMVLHSGDFDYHDNPKKWDEQINSVLGNDFPYFASIGNHDVDAWDGYQKKLQERLDRIPDAECVGELGIASSCTYGGIFFILSGVGLKNSGHDIYIKNNLSNNDYLWRICSWHLNMKDMQLGTKRDLTGWKVYEECRKGGAIIATAHEHSYSRTTTLTNIKNKTIDSEWNDRNDLKVSNGATFVFVSGLGGHSVRNQDRCLPTSFPYGCNGEWAKIYTSDQGAKPGALFCSFNVDDTFNKANCYFKDISGNVPDKFSITSMVDISKNLT